LVAAFAYAVRTNTWRSADAPVNSASNGYLRSLARRMHREATLMTEKKLLCLT